MEYYTQSALAQIVYETQGEEAVIEFDEHLPQRPSPTHETRTFLEKVIHAIKAVLIFLFGYNRSPEMGIPVTLYDSYMGSSCNQLYGCVFMDWATTAFSVISFLIQVNPKSWLWSIVHYSANFVLGLKTTALDCLMYMSLYKLTKLPPYFGWLFTFSLLSDGAWLSYVVIDPATVVRESEETSVQSFVVSQIIAIVNDFWMVSLYWSYNAEIKEYRAIYGPKLPKKKKKYGSIQ